MAYHAVVGDDLLWMTAVYEQQPHSMDVPFLNDVAQRATLISHQWLDQRLVCPSIDSSSFVPGLAQAYWLNAVFLNV